MNNWEIAAKAINEGIKIRCSELSKGLYIFYNNGYWFYTDITKTIPQFHLGTWEIYQEKSPKMYLKYLYINLEGIHETDWTSKEVTYLRYDSKIIATIEATEEQIIKHFKEKYK